MSNLVYKLDQTLDPRAEAFVISAIERSYRTRRVEITERRLTVEVEEEVSAGDFESVMANLLYVCQTFQTRVLHSHEVEQEYADDPMPHLLACGDVMRIDRGLFGYQGAFWNIFQELHRSVRDLARTYSAIEQEYPPLWPIDLYKKIDYFSEFPQQVILCTTVQDGREDRSAFASRYSSSQDYQNVDVRSGMQECRYGLQPAVCDSCYYLLGGSHDFRDKVYTTYNKVFRNEWSKTDSLDRLIAFSVRDIMFVGNQSFVVETRDRLIQDLADFMRRLLLHFRIETANDPFFTNDATLKGAFQEATQSKFEILARLNHTGADLAVGSINLHHDFFGKAFDIRTPDGSQAHSGCIGIGFERLTFALFSQYGHDPQSWPEELKSLLAL